MDKELVLAMMAEVAKEMANIGKCNDPKDKRANTFFAPLVLLVQKECDKILANNKISFLERLLLCAKEVESLQAGNCMLQSFVAFDKLLKKMIAAGVITNDKAVPISICTTSAHTFVVVGDLVCDTWGDYVGSFAEFPYAGQKMSNYFGIAETWHCYDGSAYDELSTQYTFTLMKDYAPSTTTSMDATGDASAAVDENEARLVSAFGI